MTSTTWQLPCKLAFHKHISAWILPENSKNPTGKSEEVSSKFVTLDWFWRTFYLKFFCRFGTFGAVIEYGVDRKITEQSTLAATVAVGIPQGVVLRIRLNRASQTYLFPLHLSDEVIMPVHLLFSGLLFRSGNSDFYQKSIPSLGDNFVTKFRWTIERWKLERIFGRIIQRGMKLSEIEIWYGRRNAIRACQQAAVVYLYKFICCRYCSNHCFMELSRHSWHGLPSKNSSWIRGKQKRNKRPKRRRRWKKCQGTFFQKNWY